VTIKTEKNTDLPVMSIGVKTSKVSAGNSTDPEDTLVMSKTTQSFNVKTQQGTDSSINAAKQLDNQASVQATTQALSTTAQTSSAAAVGAGLVMGPLLSILLGALFKFFQVMDNIGNLSMLNIQYGPLVLKVFDVIDSIQVSPDIDPFTWIKDTQANSRSLAKIFNKNMANASEEYEDGFILRTVPFGSVVYPLVFALFWILFKLKLFLQRKINVAKLNKLGKWSLKRLSWVAFTRTVKLFHDLKQFLFNLFVLDLSLAACFELCQSNVMAKMFTESLTSAAIFSMLMSALNLVLIIFEFYYTLTVNLAVKMTKEANNYLYVKAKIDTVEKLTKKMSLKNKDFTEVDKTKQDNKIEGFSAIKEEKSGLVEPTPMVRDHQEDILMSEDKIAEEEEEYVEEAQEKKTFKSMASFMKPSMARGETEGDVPEEIELELNVDSMKGRLEKLDDLEGNPKELNAEKLKEIS
jgi:hypothetical protein